MKELRKNMDVRDMDPDQRKVQLTSVITDSPTQYLVIGQSC